ncbi:glycosyltransferase family 39 protein [Sphingomonas aliaeris]|uniref:Glycosyltransferase family 39 protein n=1 Tax=Sphingomonas aliaeris TaxID=2759526 RepID=A0A974S3Y3_9SPHN|nr:glycosyltransferase family 39 protein [Sphingomonas aliaeris]QQV76854.1 glycosyltransferase family 39 protein [Sphingomonas aliaeris]
MSIAGSPPRRPLWAFAGLTVALVLLALVRPLDHDESQYVAAAVLTAHGQMPYRDFAYLQTPLQPFLFAPLAWLFGGWTWPGLRIVNAVLGVVAVSSVYRAARTGGARTEPALLACALFACCDILLFSVGTARNDALPVALLASALPSIMRAANGRGTQSSAALAGLLLAAAAAAKVSYALPAIGYGLYALYDRRHRPAWLIAGALPVAITLIATGLIAPQGFLFGVFDFPARAPDQYYRAIGKAWKLSTGTKLIDLIKFLALGPALLCLALASLFRWRATGGRAIDWMIVAGLVAALMPSPVWRQYLLPMLPPLFVRLAIGWQSVWPGRRTRIALVVFACAGLAPSIEAMVRAVPRVPMIDAMRQSAAIRVVMDAAGVHGPVATLSPQFLPATGRLPDARFATGPFYFRSRGLIGAKDEAVNRVVAKDTIGIHFRHPPAAILTGGEGAWTSGDPTLDGVLADWAQRNGWRRILVPGGRFTLYAPN